MAISAYSLVSLSEVKSFLSISETDSDSWLETEIDRMSQAIERYVDRKIIARQYKKDFDGTDTALLYLDNTPVLQIDALYQDFNQVFTDDSLIERTEYSTFINGVELAYSYFHYGVKSVRVDYAAGYGEIEIPMTRTRVDFREETGGDLLTVYLSGDRTTPTEIAEYLECEMNGVGEEDRIVRFDYKTRKFTITQEEGDLSLLPSDTTEGFDEDESALPLLGYTGTGHTSSPATSNTAVTLELPVDLKGAVIDLIANRYDVHYSNGEQRRGIQSKRLGSFQTTYFGDGNGGSGQLMMSKDVEEILTRYQRAVYV